MVVDYMGKTDFTFKPRRKYVPDHVPIFDGVYGVNVPKVSAVLSVMQRLEIETDRGYLITMTMSDIYNNEIRYEQRRKFLDLLRKLEHIKMYCWVTEIHKEGVCADKGLFHFHIYLISNRYWDYTADAVRWTKRYCLNSSGTYGIDIRPHNNPFYLHKYLKKDVGKMQWDKRLWGYKGFSRKIWADSPESWNEFYLEARASCHIHSGMLKIHDKDFIADSYMCRTKYAKWRAYEEI